MHSWPFVLHHDADLDIRKLRFRDPALVAAPICLHNDHMMSTSFRIHGLVAATHTPFHQEGSLNLNIIEQQAAMLHSDGVRYAFIGGTTGESSSLTLDERLQLAERWSKVAGGTALRFIVHVGSNCLDDATILAKQAQKLGACATSAVAPSYFKPSNLNTLVDCMSKIASAAPELPFYYYEIPTMTGINISPSDFLAAAAPRIPNLAGIKFTSTNLMEYLLCREHSDRAFDIPFGFDEMLLPALSLGATGAVGSSYNFAGPIYLRAMRAFAENDIDTARDEQLRAVRIIKLLASLGYMAAAKTVMKIRGVDVGPPRLPNAGLTSEQQFDLRNSLDRLGFFAWL